MISLRNVPRRLLALSQLAALPAALHAQAAPPCPRVGACNDVAAFGAAVTDFRTSIVDRGTRVLTATVRFVNRTAQPLILGYVTGSGIAIDDQGNRYTVYGPAAVRAIGEISNGNFDPKFTLRPGESSDARFEFVLQPSRSQIIGTAYDFDLAVRQIEPLAGNQFRLGKEHALHFTGFGRGGAVAASGPTAGAAPAPPTAPAPVSSSELPMDADQCGTRPRCYGAGTFVAEVTQLIAAIQGRHHVLRSTVRFRNMTAQPIILAYKTATSGVTDNIGNHYHWGRSGTHDMSSAGIGRAEGGNVDPQFQLAPGQSREAKFTLYRFEAWRAQLGTVFNQDLSVVLVEPLPSGQVRVGREFAVSFHDLSTGASAPTVQAGVSAGVSAAQRLIEAMRGKKKP